MAECEKSPARGGTSGRFRVCGSALAGDPLASVDVLVDWFDDEFLGVGVEQYLGVSALVFVAALKLSCDRRS